MKNRKRQLCRYGFYDQLAMERHFEEMAARGWLIERISNFFWVFRPIEPQKFHISVTYFPDASEFDTGPTDGQQMLEDFAAQDSWHLLTRWGQMQVFCSSVDDPTPMETDPVTQVETIWRAIKKNMFPSHLLLLALAVYQLAFNCWRAGTDLVEFLSTPHHLVSIPVWVMILFGEVNELLTCMMWCRKARPLAENGVFFPLKTNHFITLTMVLSAALVLISTVLLPGAFSSFALVWIIVLFAIIASGNLLKRGMKKAGASRRVNFTVSIVCVALLTVCSLVALTVGVIRYGVDDGREPVGSYEINDWTFDIYDEPMPLYVEDLMEIGDSRWSRERNRHSETFLLSRSEYKQDHISGGPEGLKDLGYTVIDIKLPALYDTVKRSLLNERQDEVYDDFVFTDHYEPIDAAPWNALEAYQLHWSGSILDTYLICWENRIVEITFYWQPTVEQIKTAAEILAP